MKYAISKSLRESNSIAKLAARLGSALRGGSINRKSDSWRHIDASDDFREDRRSAVKFLDTGDL